MSERPCARCGVRPRSANYSWCRECFNDWQRADQQRRRSCNRATVYALIDPRNGSVRYIGSTIGDLTDARRSPARTRTESTGMRAWIAELASLGLRHDIIALEEVSREDGPAAEAFWILHYRDLGADLVNGTADGQGGNSRYHGRLTPEQRERRSQAAFRGWHRRRKKM